MKTVSHYLPLVRNPLLAALGSGCVLLAHAQSSVVLWGIVDVNVQRLRAQGTGSVDAVGSSGLNSSQLGFKAVEDLGGGLNAVAWLEGNINPDTGTGRASNTNNQASGATVAGGLTFDRRSYVGLGGPWGQLRLGRDFSPNHYNNVSFDAFGGLGAGRAGNLAFTTVGAAAMPTTVAYSNGISYWLPADLGGLYGVAVYALGENASTAPNRGDGKLMGARLGWASGPFNVAVGGVRTTYASTATVGDYTHANIGASYSMKPATLFALVNSVAVDLSGGKIRKNTVTLGGQVPVGALGMVRASYSRLTDRSDSTLKNADGSARSGNTASQWAVGYVYNLSKRTALYGTMSRLTNRGQAAYTVSGAPAPLAGRGASGIEAGIRHLF
ncbi:MAG: porin [Pseudomonadota bacterium]